MKLNKNAFKSIPMLLVVNGFLFFTGYNGLAQTYDNLNPLPGHQTKTYYSEGSKETAETMATRCDNVLSYYKPLLDFEPNVTLLVLSPEDWSTYTNFPVYGMPHYINEQQALIVASEDNDFWKSFIPPLDQLPSELAQQISSAYTNDTNQLSMRGFFDLLAIHELGHAYHIQGGLTMQRKWMGELFCNILLHTYVAENEPQLLPALTVFPRMVVTSTNKADLKYTTLTDLETNYGIIGPQYPQNYGWYQTRWHMTAATIYDEGGITAFKNLWQALKSQKEPMEDAAFVTLLSDKAHQSIANVPLKWDE